MRSAKGRKGAKRKIGEHLVLNLDVKMRHAVDEGPKRAIRKIADSLVLILGVKVSHAVDEGPKRGQNINWRASCSHVEVKSKPCGRRMAEKGPSKKLTIVLFSFRS